MRKSSRAILALASAALMLFEPLSSFADGPGDNVGASSSASSPEGATIIENDESENGSLGTGTTGMVPAEGMGTSSAPAGNGTTGVVTIGGTDSASNGAETNVTNIGGQSESSAANASNASSVDITHNTTPEDQNTGGAGVAVMSDDDSNSGNTGTMTSQGQSQGQNANGQFQSSSGGSAASFEMGELRTDDISSKEQLLATGDFMLPIEGMATAEPVLGQTPTVAYFLRDPGGNRYDYGYSTMDNGEGLAYSAGGFQSLALEMVSIGRYYYRTYTAEHGWSPWATTRESTPASDSAKVQAIQARVKGYTHNMYELYYKAVLSDGSETDWAQGGQACGTMGGDKYIVGLKMKLWKNGLAFPKPTGRTLIGGNREGVYYDEGGNAQYSTFDGSPYTGWAFDNNSVTYYFQEGKRLTGWNYLEGYKYFFDESGKLVKDLEPIMGKTGDYEIHINKPTRTLYIMTKDGGNGYIIPYKTFNIANGDDTPIGTFHTYIKYRWKFMHDDLYCQFLARFYNGFLLHSLPYNGNHSNALDPNFYNYMDDSKSGGCIRMVAGDAAWVYENLPLGVAVVIYQDRWNKGPVEKGAIEQAIPVTQHYDPTDPVILAQQGQTNSAAARQQAEEAEKAAAKAAENAGDGTIDENA